MNLTVKGKQEFLGKQIPIIEGGFGGGQRCILVKDVARIHGVQIKYINRKIKENLDEFEEGVDLLEILEVLKQHHEISDNLGISINALNRADNIYVLSESGYMTLCMLIKTPKAKEIRKQFRREYFAMRATLVEQAEYIKVLEQRNNLLEKNKRLLEQRDELIEQRDNAVNELNKLNAVCEIPRTQLKKDIKVFMNDTVKDAIFSHTDKIELYKVYRNSRKHRAAQPPRSLFEDIVSELGYIQSGGSWLDIVFV